MIYERSFNNFSRANVKASCRLGVERALRFESIIYRPWVSILSFHSSSLHTEEQITWSCEWVVREGGTLPYVWCIALPWWQKQHSLRVFVLAWLFSSPSLELNVIEQIKYVGWKTASHSSSGGCLKQKVTSRKHFYKTFNKFLSLCVVLPSPLSFSPSKHSICLHPLLQWIKCFV